MKKIKKEKKKKEYIHLGEAVSAADAGLKRQAFWAAIFLHRDGLINGFAVCQKVALSRWEEVHKEE